MEDYEVEVKSKNNPFKSNLVAMDFLGEFKKQAEIAEVVEDLNKPVEIAIPITVEPIANEPKKKSKKSSKKVEPKEIKKSKKGDEIEIK